MTSGYIAALITRIATDPAGQPIEYGVLFDPDTLS